MQKGENNLRWKIGSLERLYAPFPFFHYLGLSNGLDSSSDLGLGEIMGADSGRIQQTRHMANFVHTILERVDSAHDEGPQEVIPAKVPFQ